MPQMDNMAKLTILKNNLQMLNNTNDEYLDLLLEQAESLMKRKGIQNDETMDYHMAQIDYAAFLFRKRANLQAPFPDHLRWELNNLLFSQKAR